MIAKDQLKQFLRHVSQTPNEPFMFQLAGSQQDALQFVHRMRVELSRLRTLIRNSGRQPKLFKMLLISVTPAPGNTDWQEVTLRYSPRGTGATQQDISEIFNLAATDDRQIPAEIARNSVRGGPANV